MLKNLKVIARKVVETNNSLCFHLFCLDKITFYMNDSVKTCQKGSKMVYCNEFSLMFQQGTISNSDLSDTSILNNASKLGGVFGGAATRESTGAGS